MGVMDMTVLIVAALSVAGCIGLLLGVQRRMRLTAELRLRSQLRFRRSRKTKRSRPNFWS